MSDVFRWYLGGLLATAAEFSLLVAPTVNSYKRFLPGSWAPTGIGWGVDNRTLGFRIVGHGQGMRVENRIPGADANTYHAFAATIAGGLYGLANKIDPPPAYDGNGYTATDLPRIPATFVEAIELWRNSDDRQGVLRRRRPPPRAALRRDRVGGVQPHRHRLGAAQVLRTDLDGRAVRTGALALGVDGRAVEDRLRRRHDDLAVAVARSGRAVDDQAEPVGCGRWPDERCRRVGCDVGQRVLADAADREGVG